MADEALVQHDDTDPRGHEGFRRLERRQRRCE